ncbi:hypothetical protein BDV18DRAFT_160831 [Aspergillus unguis]
MQSHSPQTSSTLTCRNPAECQYLLNKVTPSMFHDDVQNSMYNPRPAQFQRSDHESPPPGSIPEAEAFAQYKRHYHAMLHQVAGERGASVSQAWEEIEMRRWRWTLAHNRNGRELTGSARERRGAISGIGDAMYLCLNVVVQYLDITRA